MKYKLRSCNNGNHARRTIGSFLIILILLFLSYNIFQPTDQTTYSVSADQIIYNDPPSMNFNAAAINRSSIRLNWTQNDTIDSTRVEFSYEEVNGSWDVEDYTLLVNTSEMSHKHDGLSPGESVFYKAWQWNQSHAVWIVTETTNATTDSNNPPTCDSTTPANGAPNQELSLDWIANLLDLDGDCFDWSIQCSNQDSCGASDATDAVSYTHLTLPTN